MPGLLWPCKDVVWEMGWCLQLVRQGPGGAPAHLACQTERLVAWGGVGREVEAQALRRRPCGWLHGATARERKCATRGTHGAGNGVVGTHDPCTTVARPDWTTPGRVQLLIPLHEVPHMWITIRSPVFISPLPFGQDWMWTAQVDGRGAPDLHRARPARPDAPAIDVHRTLAVGR